MGKTLVNRVVVITGASSGIGAATALALADQGARLILGARRVEKLQAVADEAQRRGGQAVAMPCDVAQRPQVAALVQAALDRFGRLDVMIANAGYGQLARIHEMSEQDFDDIVRTNIKGSWYAMQEAAVPMLAQHAGHIILISSAAARRGLPLYGVYSMTKAAQLSLAEAMRVEMAGKGVYVSTVHPITTATEFFDVASARSNIHTRGMGPAQTAELVARKIVGLIRRPKPELWPHALSRWGLGLSALFPRLTDRAMQKAFPRRTLD